MAKFWADGTTISIAGTDIGGLDSIGLPDRERSEVNLMDHDSGGDWEGVPGTRDNGTVALEGHLDPEDAGQEALRTNFDATDGSTEEFVITLPSQSAATTPVTYTFDGFVTNLSGELVGGDNNESGSFSATIKVTGAVTFDVGT